jgi:SP family arabinose:H+ symporter-like MFS transporter
MFNGFSCAVGWNIFDKTSRHDAEMMMTKSINMSDSRPKLHEMSAKTEGELPGMTSLPKRYAPLAFATGVASLGGLLFGFDTAVIAGTTQALSAFFHLSPIALGLTVSCALWGTVLGGLLASFPGNRYGGRASLRLTAILYFLSALGCAFAQHWTTFLMFRIVGGFAIGGCSVFGPMYVAEIAPAALRGRLVGCFQLSIVSGILLAYASNDILDRLQLGRAEWRYDLGVAAGPALFFFVALRLIPDSARWLLKKGRLAEATAALKKLGSTEPEAETQILLAALAEESGLTKTSILAPAFRRPLAIALALGFFNQFSGINAVLYYLNAIFARAGFSGLSAGRQAVWVGFANLLFTMAGMALIDRVGRKPLLLAGAAGMAAALAGIAWLFFTGRHPGWLLPLLVLFIASFAISQGAVVWVYLSEIFPSAVRESGQSVASAWLWLLTAIITGVFPRLAAVSGAYPFSLFAVAMLAQFAVVVWLFPETKGRSLETIGAELELSKPTMQALF